LTAVYDAAYARRYRTHDDSLDDSRPYLELAGWVQELCARFEPGVDALDLGCGTGRYFSALRGVRSLVGLDASAEMLAEAAQPIHPGRITVGEIRLVHGDLASHDFPDGSFNLVYSIGVLAEHVPLDERVVARVRRWLRPSGRFAFTTVHPDSHSIPRTIGRRAGRAALAFVPDVLAGPLRNRLLTGGRYADERRIAELLSPSFTIESLDRFVSEAHLHCRCVARLTGPR
jgi:SAM-dependent methyltransferase